MLYLANAVSYNKREYKLSCYFKTINRHLLGKPAEYQTRGRTDDFVEGPAHYFLIGCPVIRRVRAGTDCHRPGFKYRTLATCSVISSTYRLSYHCRFIIHRPFIVLLVQPRSSGSIRAAAALLWIFRYYNEIPRCSPRPLRQGGASGRFHLLTLPFPFLQGRRRWSVHCLSGPPPLVTSPP